MKSSAGLVRSSCYGGSNDESRETTEATTAATPEAATTAAAVMAPLILKRAPLGDNQED
jgi:hypothetical protein